MAKKPSNAEEVKTAGHDGATAEILDVRYQRIPTRPFSEPPKAESAAKARRSGG